MQEVIVYRNPLEAALWQSLSGAEFFPVIVGILAFFVSFIIVNAVIGLVFPRISFRKHHYKSYVALAVAAMCGIGVFFLMAL